MKPLAGKRVVVTRPQAQAEGLARLIGEAGGEALRIPAIEIRALDDPAPFLALADRLASFDIAIFVSRNAVRRALALLAPRLWPARLRVATVGMGSREELEAHGFVDAGSAIEGNSTGLNDGHAYRGFGWEGHAGAGVVPILTD